MKKITVFLILILSFQLNAQSFKNDLNPHSRFVNYLVYKSGAQRPVEKFALKQLLNVVTINNGDFTFRQEKQQMDSIVYWTKETLGGMLDSLGNDILTYFTYKDNGKTDVEMFAKKDTVTNEWNDVMKLEMKYNQDETVKRAIISYYYNNAIWIEGIKANFVYDEEKMLTEIDIVYLDSETFEWKDMMKLLFTRNESGLVTVLTAEKIDENTGEWQDVAEFEIYYLNDSNVIDEVIIHTNIDYYPKDYNTTLKVKMVYDGDGKLVREDDYYLFETINQWFKIAKKEYYYDDHENVEKIMSYSKIQGDTITFTMRETGKKEFQYNNDYSYTDLIVPYSYISVYLDMNNKMYFNHMLTYSVSYVKTVGKEWVKSNEANYYYSSGNYSAVDEKEFRNVKIYPNPVTDEFSVSLPSNGTYNLKIFDMTGKVIKSGPVKNSQNVNVSAFPGGIYFYKISKNGKTFSGKFVKQ